MTDRALDHARRLRAVLDREYAGWEVGEMTLIGHGLDAAVFRAQSRAFGTVAIRAPWTRWISNDNDPAQDARALLAQEQLLANYMHGCGVPTPRAFALHTGADDFDFLVSAYVEDDGSALESAAIGALMRRIHDAPITAEITRTLAVAPLAETLATRISERLLVVRRLADTPLRPVRTDALREALAVARYRASVLHMDVRRPNIRVVDGQVRAILDWSNALLGDPALELARATEFGVRDDAFDAGYGERPTPPVEIDAIYHLDTAVMLAVVFLSEAPDPVRAKRQVERVRELLADLGIP